MNKLKHIVAVMIMAVMSFAANAQDTAASANTDIMKSNGKIYVVMVVVVVIVAGLFLYLLRLDRKISKLEKQ